MTVGELIDVLLTKFNWDAELLFRVNIPVGICSGMSDVLCKYSDIGKVDNSVTIYLDEVEDS
jgi:hypothetical protein|nr:MAG TPA: hypothetical protein [Caudoviricetes sp.]